jgi:hypothetical protein
MEHHTKDKGDLGLAATILTLKKVGINVCLPISEHLPFDLIAVSKTGILKKVSVKHRVLRSTGILDFTLRSCWADKHGTHTVYHDKSEYDCLAFYCPDTETCYFVRIDEIPKKTVYIRVKPSKRPSSKVLNAEDLINPERIFNNTLNASLLH